MATGQHNANCTAFNAETDFAFEGRLVETAAPLVTIKLDQVVNQFSVDYCFQGWREGGMEKRMSEKKEGD